MPYVAVGQPSRKERLDAAAARWEATSRNFPDLRQAVTLQRRLLGVMINLLDTLGRTGVPRVSLPPRYVAAKLGRSVPAFAGEPVPLPAAILGPAVVEICDVLASGGAGDAARHVASALKDGRMTAGSLVTASFARDRRAILSGAAHHDLAPDLLWLVAEMATSPFAHVLQRRVLMPDAHPTLAAALDGWTHGYCAACGSWPALAEVWQGHSVLRCSFCALAWILPERRCIYCREPTADDVRSARRLQTCTGCSGYLKHAPVESLSPAPLLAVTDLETMDLDVTAAEQGFHRPDLLEFTAGR
jgi:FdhE protein